MSMLETSLLLGGSVRQSVDMETGEILAPVPPATCEDGTERGLSTCHNSPQIVVRLGGSLMTVKRAGRAKEGGKVEGERSKRGKVAGFSAKSRNRLMRTLASVKRENLPLFVTLTFPAEYPNIEKAKRFLDTFIKRLARKFPEIAGVWKLEPQKRGAPHFHLLVWGADYLGMLCFVPQAWYEIVGSGDPNHLAWHSGELGNSPCVQRIEKQRGVFWYASKYMSKEVSETYAEWGRWWGVFFRERLPLAQLVQMEVNEKKAIEFIRYMRRYAHIRSRDYKSLTVICNPDFWVNRLL